MQLTEKYFGDMVRSKEEQNLDPKNTSSASSASSTSESSLSSFSSSSTSSSSPPPSTQPSKILSKMPFFKNLSTSAAQQATVSPLDVSLLQHPITNMIAPSHYTGGFLALPPIPPPANPSHPHLSHIHLAFEALPISSPDIYALATLQTLLGGGGSFSAGGPGKGMYSRLYTNVLNQNGWVENCMSFNHSYTDSGLFGISASCVPSKLTQMLEVMCRELSNLTLDSGYSSLQQGEVTRAKNQLKSSLLMNLESRMVELEDLGRQVQVHGRKISVREMCERIEALTIQDLRRVAKEIFGGQVHNIGQGSGAPTVVVQEGAQENGLSSRAFKWSEAQERIWRWKLGRK